MTNTQDTRHDARRDSGDVARRADESLLQNLVRISSPTHQRHEAAVAEAKAIQHFVVTDLQPLVQTVDEAAEQWSQSGEYEAGKEAHHLEDVIMQFEIRLMKRVRELLAWGFDLQPEHEAAWVNRLYAELDEVREALEALVVAVAQSTEVSADLRATVERQYNELIERLDRAEDNPHAAIAAFGQLVRFIELIIELSLKFGGQLQGIWQGVARPVIVPLLH
jgi:hypothetical protein